MSCSKRFLEEAFGRLSISGRGEQKFQGASLRIHSTIEIRPHLLHFDVGLIDAPRVIRRFEMGSAALLSFWGVVLHPTVDRGVIDIQAPLEHHLLQVSIAERIAQVPVDTQQNNLSFKMTPFERG